MTLKSEGCQKLKDVLTLLVLLITSDGALWSSSEWTYGEKPCLSTHGSLARPWCSLAFWEKSQLPEHPNVHWVIGSWLAIHSFFQLSEIEGARVERHSGTNGQVRWKQCYPRVGSVQEGVFPLEQHWQDSWTTHWMRKESWVLLCENQVGYTDSITAA